MVGVVPPPTPPLCAVNGRAPFDQNVTEKEAPPPPADVSEPPAPPVTVAVTVQPPGGAIHSAPAALPSATLSPVPTGSTGAGEALGVGEELGVGDDVGEMVFEGVAVGVGLNVGVVAGVGQVGTSAVEPAAQAQAQPQGVQAAAEGAPVPALKVPAGHATAVALQEPAGQ